MNAYIIKRPLITEKTLMLAGTQRVYTFEVERTASKKQIQDLVQQLYNVSVLSVNTVSGHRSLISTGRKRIKKTRAKTKKAFVKLAKDNHIALFDIPGVA